MCSLIGYSWSTRKSQPFLVVNLHRRILLLNRIRINLLLDNNYATTSITDRRTLRSTLRRQRLSLRAPPMRTSSYCTDCSSKPQWDQSTLVVRACSTWETGLNGMLGRLLKQNPRMKQWMTTSPRWNNCLKLQLLEFVEHRCLIIYMGLWRRIMF